MKEGELQHFGPFCRATCTQARQRQCRLLPSHRVQENHPTQLSSVTKHCKPASEVTQLSLPPEICRHGTRGSKIQADIYVYSTLFIPSHPFLHAGRFAEHWRLCSQSAGLWVRAFLQQNRSDKPQIPVCAAWNWNIWSRNIFLTTSICIHLGICNKIRSPPKMSILCRQKSVGRKVREKSTFQNTECSFLNYIFAAPSHCS